MLFFIFLAWSSVVQLWVLVVPDDQAILFVMVAVVIVETFKMDHDRKEENHVETTEWADQC